MVRTATAGENPPVDARRAAKRDSVGYAGAIYGLAAFLAASCTGHTAAWRARDARSDSATAGIRSSGECVGTADFAASCGGIRFKGARSTLPDGRGGMGQAVAAPGNPRGGW